MTVESLRRNRWPLFVMLDFKGWITDTHTHTDTAKPCKNMNLLPPVCLYDESRTHFSVFSITELIAFLQYSVWFSIPYPEKESQSDSI